MVPELHWLDTQFAAMVSTLTEWANLNTGTRNIEGLNRQAELIAQAFQGLGDGPELLTPDPYENLDERGELVVTPLGPCVRVRCRREAPLRVLLAIHMDTVYGPETAFQRTDQVDPRTLRGPGVADAKGGLVVMLFALRAVEQFVARTGCDQLGWDVLINADEEIGSPGSLRFFEEFSRDVDLGLLYEPALPDGGLASSRKGSGNFAIRLRGRSAHAGRDFHLGRNAIAAAAMCAAELHRLNGRWPGTTINVARIDGGGPVNIVPERGVVRFNVRYPERELEEDILASIDTLMETIREQLDVNANRFGDFSAPPKNCDPLTEELLDHLREAAAELGFPLTWQATGGVCDGNRLAACGIPNVDSLGVRGGGIHSPDEFVLLDSLTERAQLTTWIMIKLANGTIRWPGAR